MSHEPGYKPVVRLTRRLKELVSKARKDQVEWLAC